MDYVSLCNYSLFVKVNNLRWPLSHQISQEFYLWYINKVNMKYTATVCIVTMVQALPKLLKC